LIIEAQEGLKSNQSNIDLQQLKIIYNQATAHITNIQKTFEDLVEYHNAMVIEKVKFITKELPILEQTIIDNNKTFRSLLETEKKLTHEISKSDSFEELEKVIVELTEKYRQKGEYETMIEQLNEVDSKINTLQKQLNEIDNYLFSDSSEQALKKQLDKFNICFAYISNQLYGEQYAVNYDIVTKKQKLYKFSAFNANMSSGKKQGEISCFDLAYILFADEENIPCLHFILNDKKELMHDNQLVKIAEFVNDSNNNIQFIASILNDKLPEQINKEEYFIVKLSQDDKLFRIE
jgi:uncharacterized protein YydD (DUF2326 family)